MEKIICLPDSHNVVEMYRRKQMSSYHVLSATTLYYNMSYLEKLQAVLQSSR